MTKPPTHSWMVHVRSKDCLELVSGFNTEIQVTLAAAIARIPGHAFHISLSSAEIPYTWYNVSGYLKSAEIMVDSASASSLTVEDGNYDIYELISAINASSSFPYSITYNSKTNKVKLTNTDSTEHEVNFSSENSRELSKMLGFDRLDRTISAGGQLESDGVVNLRIIHSMFLYSDLAASNVLTTTFDGNVENIIDKIPLGSANPLEMINYDYYETAPFSSIITTEAIQTFKLSLRDQNSRLIQLNGARYELSILIEQRLAYQFEIDHPSHPYPEIGRRSDTMDKKAQDKKQEDEEEGEEEEDEKDQGESFPDPRSPRPPPPRISSGPQPQPLGGSTIKIASSTPSIDAPSIRNKRPRIIDEQLQRQALELDQAIMFAHDSFND